MVIYIGNGIKIDKKAIKPILTKIYEAKPDFPIKDVNSLTTILGGKDQLLFINEIDGDMPATVIAKNVFENTDQIFDPNQVIDSLIADSFVNVITKAILLNQLENLIYPIKSKDDFHIQFRDLGIFSIPIEILSKKIDYPIETSDQIINGLNLLEKELMSSDVESVMNVVESPDDSNIIEVDTKIIGSATADENLSEDDKEVRKKILILIEEGKNAYREKRYDDALRIYEMGLNLDSDDTELRFLKNSVLKKIQDLQKSQADKVKSSEELGSVSEKTAETVHEFETKPEPEKGPEPETETETESESPPDSIPQSMETDNQQILPETGPETGKDTIDEETKSQPSTMETTDSTDNFEEANTNEQTELKIEQNGPSTNDTDLSGPKLDSKIEELGKRLQERVSRLKNLSTTTTTPIELSEDSCKSCEGKGECYWCKNSGKCSKCSGTGKSEDDSDCETCKGTGVCHSCNGSGKCHWCNGTGKKKLN
jgi:hypothetical protein